MKLGIRTKLFLVSLGLIVVSVLIGYGYLGSQLERALTETVRSDLHARARLVAHEAGTARVGPDGLDGWQALAVDLGQRASARVTLIRSDGVVAGDSEVSARELGSVENHRDRPEVQAALAGRPGDSVRYSTTVGRRMLYVAEPFERDGRIAGVARVAVPLVQVDAAVQDLRKVAGIGALLAIAVAIVLSSVAAQLASQTARSLTEAARRMASGDLETRTGPHGQDEFGELGRALDALAQSLSTTLAELTSERDRVSGILSGMQEGVLLLDREGRIALVNPALREMLLLASDSVGKRLLELVRHAELKGLLDEARASEEPLVREIDLPGLRPGRLLVRAAPMAGKDGGVFAVFVDVTAMRRLESLRRDFVANVSHELRTPVTAIRSAAETLPRAVEDDPEAAKRFVEIIDRNAERLRGLVEDLLDLSRIESREFRLDPVPLDLGQVATQVLSLFRERAEKKGIRVIGAVADDLPQVRADRRALEHVLTNLIDNAVKYCGAGAEVSVSAKPEHGKLRVTVRDTGPGIEARHLPRIFERFYRVDAGRSRELGGTGLGLAIVKHLVEAMGGTVDVTSELGRGTCFGFTLSVADAPEERSATAATADTLNA